MADTNYRMPVAQSQAIVEALAGFSDISLAIVFGSVATGSARPDSDLDIAVASARGPLAAAEKISMIQALAETTGRPIDLIDLATVGQPLLGQVVQHGQKIRGSSTAYGQLISRHVLDEADFMPIPLALGDTGFGGASGGMRCKAYMDAPGLPSFQFMTAYIRTLNAAVGRCL